MIKNTELFNLRICSFFSPSLLLHIVQMHIYYEELLAAVVIPDHTGLDVKGYLSNMTTHNLKSKLTVLIWHKNKRLQQSVVTESSWYCAKLKFFKY